jgi:hypothetical protein
MQDAGMEKPTAQLVQSGPIAEARTAQGDLEKTAQEDPAKVLAGQQDKLAKADQSMAKLQAEAVASLTKARASTTKGAATQQVAMVGSEESQRKQIADKAQTIFNTTRDFVTKQLNALPGIAMGQWDEAKKTYVLEFKADLKVVQDKVDKRHSGVGGFFVGLWDAVTGLPDWATKAYDAAESSFAEKVIAKIRKISADVNGVIGLCELQIKNAKKEIAQLFADAKTTLGDWADKEAEKFDKQLDKLKEQAHATRDNFNKELVNNAAQAVDEVRAEIAELRKKAGGLLGRIADAIGRFIDDPIKFIIEGLLELVGIPPASFWAVVAKIKKVVGDIADDPMKFANNLMAGLAQGFSQFLDNIGTHLFKGFISWLTGGLGDAGVQLPKDTSLKSIITFFLQLMGITWPRIRKLLAKHIGEKNVALIEKVYAMVSFLIEKGPEGIFEMIKEKLNPQAIVDQVIKMAIDFLISAVIKAATARILMLFNPAGAIFQALEAIYRVLKWIFQNAAKIFTLIETVVNGIADILAGSIGGFANAVEKALAGLIAPVIAFIADYFGFGDLPQMIAEKIKSFQAWIMSLLEEVLVFLIAKGKALLAALGIGGKDKDKKGGTPHEQAVEEVADTLAEPLPGDQPQSYEEVRKAKEKEAATIVNARNESLAAENVKMSVIFANPKEDEEDDDLDFTVEIAPNTAKAKKAAPIKKAEPVAGLHVVKRDTPIANEKVESHHVPPKGLGTAIASFLEDVASELTTGEWKGNRTAAAIAKACADRAKENRPVAKAPAENLSAILMDAKAHTEEEGVHTVEGAGPVLKKLAENPAEDEIVLVKRQTESEIKALGYISVNPRISSWRIFLADIRRSIDDPSFKSRPGEAPNVDEQAVDLILASAEKKFMDAEQTAEEFLTEQVLDRVNEVLAKAVDHAYRAGTTTVEAALKGADIGTPKGRKKALADLRGYFTDSWSQFRNPITRGRS